MPVERLGEENLLVRRQSTAEKALGWTRKDLTLPAEQPLARSRCSTDVFDMAAVVDVFDGWRRVDVTCLFG